MPEDDVRPEAAPSFDINQDYKDTYLRANYESDEDFELKKLEEDLHKIVLEKIYKMPIFANLKPLESKNLTPGMEVKIQNQKKGVIVSKVSKDVFAVRVNDGKIYDTRVANIDHAVDPIMKLKKAQVQELYSICEQELFKKHGRYPDIISFCFMFTEYFKINLKYMFNCLHWKLQGKIVAELQSRGHVIDEKMKDGAIMKKGIDFLFNSSE